MNCRDCAKELKGGFGVGDKPFSAWLCFDCLMVTHEHFMSEWRLKQIRKLLTDLPTPEARKLKEYEREVNSVFGQIKVLCS